MFALEMRSLDEKTFSHPSLSSCLWIRHPLVLVIRKSFLLSSRTFAPPIFITKEEGIMLELLLVIAIYSLWIAFFLGLVGLLAIRFYVIIQSKPNRKEACKMLLLPFSLGFIQHLEEKPTLQKIYSISIWIYAFFSFLGTLLLFYNYFL